LERDALIAHVRRQRTELHHSPFTDRHVLDETHPVPDAVRAAVLERLPDGWRAERLARMDRDREVLAAAELKRFDMRLRRMAGLPWNQRPSSAASVVGRPV